MTFDRLGAGHQGAMKEYHRKLIKQIQQLITLIQGELSPNDRQKIMTISTIDVHARDVIAGLIKDGAEDTGAFVWQSQLRTRWDDTIKSCMINICDAEFTYSYEYLGNVPRLVVTPLTGLPAVCDRGCASF